MTNISRRSVSAATAAGLEKVCEQAELMEAATKRSTVTRQVISCR